MSKDELVKTIRLFFPQDGYNEEVVADGVKNGDIITDQSLLINYLQGALHDESLLEVELGNITRVFFCRILDHPPEEDTSEQENKYNKGDYLNDRDHLILTPLEPSEGNYP